MTPDYWQRQEDKPIFPELEWSRPENRLSAGKLLVIGGNLYGFSAPAEAYAASVEAGIGVARVLLPDALQKNIGKVLENGEFAPSTPSGSFGQKALNELLVHSSWADATLIAGDLGRNSETAILIENFLSKTTGITTVTKDAVDYAISASQTAVERKNTLLVLSFTQLQRLSLATKTASALTFSMDILRFVGWLHDFTLAHKTYIVVKHLDKIFVAVDGKVSSTKLKAEMPIWRVKTAAAATVWWLQNPNKPFEAITTSIIKS